MLPQSVRRVRRAGQAAYDKRVRDVRADRQRWTRYLESLPGLRRLSAPDRRLRSSARRSSACRAVAAIKDRCARQRASSLAVAAGPVYMLSICRTYEPEDRRAVSTRSLATGHADFWDFSCSSVSCEPRYFYDGTHFRNATSASMMCRAHRRAGRISGYIPDDFGTYVTADTPEEYFTDVLSPAALSADEISTQVPILMYHHLSEDVTNSEMVSPEQFEAQIRALSEAGYTRPSRSTSCRRMSCGASRFPRSRSSLPLTTDTGAITRWPIRFCRNTA